MCLKFGKKVEFLGKDLVRLCSSSKCSSCCSSSSSCTDSSSSWMYVQGIFIDWSCGHVYSVCQGVLWAIQPFGFVNCQRCFVQFFILMYQICTCARRLRWAILTSQCHIVWPANLPIRGGGYLVWTYFDNNLKGSDCVLPPSASCH